MFNGDSTKEEKANSIIDWESTLKDAEHGVFLKDYSDELIESAETLLEYEKYFTDIKLTATTLAITVNYLSFTEELIPIISELALPFREITITIKNSARINQWDLEEKLIMIFDELFSKKKADDLLNLSHNIDIQKLHLHNFKITTGSLKSLLKHLRGNNEALNLTNLRMLDLRENGDCDPGTLQELTTWISNASFQSKIEILTGELPQKNIKNDYGKIQKELNRSMTVTERPPASTQSINDEIDPRANKDKRSLSETKKITTSSPTFSNGFKDESPLKKSPSEKDTTNSKLPRLLRKLKLRR